MASHNELGKWGEEVASAYLEQKGYRIVERDWKSGHRDIDLIAISETFIVFVEVKTRSNRDFGEPYEAIDKQKLRNLRSAIHHYICSRRPNRRPRLDVISIVMTDPIRPEIEHFEDIQML